MSSCNKIVTFVEKTQFNPARLGGGAGGDTPPPLFFASDIFWLSGSSNLKDFQLFLCLGRIQDGKSYRSKNYSFQNP